jgi:anaerobic selenocysteine-containing dehydrogenase
MAREVIKSDCILCINSCGIDATVEDGKLVKVRGMKEHPISEGVLCPRGNALPEWVYSPDRLQYPMKKADSGWKRISWDEALDTTAEKLQEIKDKYGARALAVYTGSLGTENIELAAFAQRFRGVYGTPNLLSVEGNCFRSRIMARQMTFGGYPIEEPWNSKCILVFGTNVDNSKITVGAKIYKALDEGTMEQVIVVDPKRIPLADKGIHIKIRPGTDTALCLGMLNVIISEGSRTRRLSKNTPWDSTSSESMSSSIRLKKSRRLHGCLHKILSRSPASLPPRNRPRSFPGPAPLTSISTASREIASIPSCRR